MLSILLRCVVLLALLPLSVAAQSFKNHSDFEVEGYRLDQRGYPGQLVADPSGNLIYTEWWMAGKGGRRHSGYYLQSVDADRYEENWFRALSKAGEPLFTPVKLIRMAEAIAVVGRVPDPSTKGENVVVRFFAFGGPEKGTGYVLQRLAKQPGQFTVHLATDPAGRRLLYYGVDHSLSIRQREHFCAVVTTDGQIQWSRALDLQSAGLGARNLDKYAVQPPVIDASGAVSFLTIPVAYSGSLADAQLPPRLLRYDPRSKIIGETVVQFGYNFLEAALQQLPSGDLIVLGLVVDGGAPNNFWNGKAPERSGDGKGKHWGRVGYLRASADGKVKAKKLFAIPDSIGKAYQRLGPNLTEQRLLYAGSGPMTETAPTDLYWMWEEAYRADGGKGSFVRGEVAVFAFDTRADSLVWGRRLIKRQRSSRNELLLGAAPALTAQWLRLVYVDESATELRLCATSLNRAHGGSVRKDLIERASDYNFFPSRSTQLDAKSLMLLGAGRTGENYYRLIHVLLD